MIIDAADQEHMRSLAEAIAIGGTAEEWAFTNTIGEEIAIGWTELPEFREHLEKCRIAYCERLVGKIGRCSDRAIDRLVEFSEQNNNANVGLSATNAILDQWVKLSVYFVQEQTYQTLQAQAKVIVAAKKAEKAASKRRW